MDKSRGSSCEAVSGCKRPREVSPSSALDLELEAELRSKLEEAGQAAREQAARDRAAWAAGPDWSQSSKQGHALGSGPPRPRSGPSPPPVVDPWEAAAASGGGGSSSSGSLPVLGGGLKSPSLLQYGTGLPGCAFFAFDSDLPTLEVAPSLSNAAIVHVKDQKISPQTPLDGLRIWDEAGWDWQVAQISEHEFSVVFPFKECLRMIASCTSFTLPLNQLVISVKPATCNGTAVGPLSQVWELIDDLLAGLHSSAFLMAVGVLIGKPVEVDSESLTKYQAQGAGGGGGCLSTPAAPFSSF
ncbi:hypothetical protein VPH35_003315 [Triticum aestivum]